ncbi:MAG: Gfo/Idh/MocA family protein [Bryobacteraceae bacterium]
MDRRNFLISSAAALSAGASAFGAASDALRVAVVGIGGRSRDHIAELIRQPNVEIVAICDPDDSHLARGQKQIAAADQKAPQNYRDVRKLLDDKSIDAITIAAPNHWHTLMTVWACQAGKDVYVEKPCSYNMFEARQIVAAARKYNRMVQQGSQIRSSAAVQEAVQKMNDGLIGDIYLARALCFKWRNTIGHAPVEAVPAGVDYDLWTGPSPQHQFTRNRIHYKWHWFWDTGNGEIGNQAIHELDVARWGLGVQYPVKISAVGGHFMFDDDQETPNVLNCAYEFEVNGKRRMMECEVRHWITNGEATVEDRGHNAIGNLFYGSKGYLAVDSYASYKSWLGREQTPGPERREGGDHFANWLDAVRTRKRETLHCEVEEGAISTTLVHLANISYRLGRTLNFDPASYCVTGDAEADKMFTRDYRKPFAVPEKV